LELELMAKDPYPGATRCLYLSCPICGMSKPLNKKGSAATMRGKPLTKGVKGLQHFNAIDPATHSVLQERACLGPPLGFKPTRRLTLSELKDDPALGWVKAELIQQCRGILSELGESEE
jgi:hypothetical protein